MSDYIRETYYRDLGDGHSAFEIIAEHNGNMGAHISISAGAYTTDISIFNLSDADLVKLNKGVTNAMQERGVPLVDYAVGREFGYNLGYADGKRDAFNQAADQMTRAIDDTFGQSLAARAAWQKTVPTEDRDEETKG